MSIGSSDTITIDALAGATAALTEETRPSRPPQRLYAETPAQRVHLEAARALDLGPMPATIIDEGHPLGWRTRLAGSVDTLGFRAMRRLFAGAHRGDLDMARGYGELEGGWLRRSEESTAPGAEALHRRLYAPAPEAPRDLETRRVAKLPGGQVEDLSFSSASYSDRASAKAQLAAHPQNADARARCYRHQGRGHPALLWLHGWGMGFARLEAQVAQARWLYDLGLDVYLVTLPYHAHRRPRGVHFAGDVFPTTHIARSNEGFLQALWECRCLIAWHRARGGGAVGAMGISLGGYVAAMLASFAPELSFSVPLIPCADVPTLMWSNGEGTAERIDAEAGGVTFDVFVRAMAVHAPLSHRLAIPKDRVLLVGARGDRIIPPAHTRALHRHWGEPQLEWIAGGHLLPFGREQNRAVLEAWLRSRV